MHVIYNELNMNKPNLALFDLNLILILWSNLNIIWTLNDTTQNTFKYIIHSNSNHIDSIWNVFDLKLDIDQTKATTQSSTEPNSRNDEAYLTQTRPMLHVSSDYSHT